VKIPCSSNRTIRFVVVFSKHYRPLSNGRANADNNGEREGREVRPEVNRFVSTTGKSIPRVNRQLKRRERRVPDKDDSSPRFAIALRSIFGGKKIQRSIRTGRPRRVCSIRPDQRSLDRRDPGVLGPSCVAVRRSWPEFRVRLARVYILLFSSASSHAISDHI